MGEIDLESLFDRPADARLIDRRREELGLAPRTAPGAMSTPRFGAESMVEDADAAPRPALLCVATDARPAGGLIPGAVVTVVVSLHDEGDTPVEDVRVRVAVPLEVEPVPGSFARDEIEIDGAALLGEGLRIGAIAPGTPARLRFVLRVLPGIEPIDVAVHASAAAPVIAAPTLRLARRSQHAAYAEPKPFFELEAGEAADGIAAPPAPAREPASVIDAVVDEPIVPEIIIEPEPVVQAVEPQPVVQAVEPQPVVQAVEPEPVVQAVEPQPVVQAVEPQPVAQAAEPQPVAEPVPVMPTVRVAETVLYCAVTADDVRALERVYAGGVPNGLAALALLAAVACSGGPAGAALGLEPFRSSVAAALPRALVAARMGKQTPQVVTAEALSAVRADAAVPDVPFVATAPSLVVRLDDRERDALRAVLARDLSDPFLRGVQLLLAIAPRAIDGLAAPAPGVAKALGAYRSAAGAWLMRVTVRRALDRRYDPLTADDAALHAAGRAVVAALREALGTANGAS